MGAWVGVHALKLGMFRVGNSFVSLPVWGSEAGVETGVRED